MTDVGELLRRARRQAGLSQRELADRSGTTQSAISAYESGARHPRSDTLQRLLAAAGHRLSATPAPDTIRDYLATRPVASSYRPWTLDRLARRVAGGEDLWFALREFLDDASLAASGGTQQDLAVLIRNEPPRTSDRRIDAFLAALAEHLAAGHGLACPAWAGQPDRFLITWWFAVPRPAFEAMAVRDSPAAFRRRGIFIAASTLDRC